MRLAGSHLDAGRNGQDGESIDKDIRGRCGVRFGYRDGKIELPCSYRQHVRIADQKEGRQAELTPPQPGHQGYVRADAGRIALRQRKRARKRGSHGGQR
jgi:hypothetical protein